MAHAPRTCLILVLTFGLESASAARVSESDMWDPPFDMVASALSPVASLVDKVTSLSSNNVEPPIEFARLKQEGLHVPPTSLPEAALAAEEAAGEAVLGATKRGESGWAQDSLATRLGSDERWESDPAWAQEKSSLPGLQPSRAPASRIPHVILQTMENWDGVTAFRALQDSVTQLRKVAAAGGWEYRFFNASAREELVTKCPVLSRMGLVIEASETDERAVIAQIVSAADAQPQPSADAATELLRNQNNLGIRLSLDYAAELGQPRARRGVPVSELYLALTDPVTRADFFRVLAIYAYGGLYLDIKSGIKTDKHNVNNVLFGPAGDDGNYTYSDTRSALTYWGPGPGVAVFEAMLNKPAQAELPSLLHEEFVTWGFAAQPQHRYMFRVAEHISRQIYLLRQSLRYTGKEGFVLPTGDLYQTVGELPDYIATGRRKANIEELTGPFAFTNAIVQEMWRDPDEIPRLVNVARSVDSRGIVFLSAADYEAMKPHKYESGGWTGLVRSGCSMGASALAQNASEKTQNCFPTDA